MLALSLDQSIRKILQEEIQDRKRKSERPGFWRQCGKTELSYLYLIANFKKDSSPKTHKTKVNWSKEGF